MRLFIAISLPDEVRSELEEFIRECRVSAPKLKWVRTANLHVTLKFLGETPEAKRTEIGEALAAVKVSEPIPIEVRGLGFFPNARRPRVLWAGVESSAGLSALAEKIDQSMHAVGFAREARPFSPHLTLARIDDGVLPAAFAAMVERESKREFGAFTGTEFHLIQSKLKPSGAEYTVLQSFRITG